MLVKKEEAIEIIFVLAPSESRSTSPHNMDTFYTKGCGQQAFKTRGSIYFAVVLLITKQNPQDFVNIYACSKR